MKPHASAQKSTVKEQTLKKMFTHTLISGKASKFILHFLSPRTFKSLQNRFHQLCPQPQAGAVCGAPSNLLLPMPGLTDPLALSLIQCTKWPQVISLLSLAPSKWGFFYSNFHLSLHALKSPHRTHDSLYFHAVGLKLLSFTWAYNTV